MRKKTIHLSVALCLSAFLLSACSKDETSSTSPTENNNATRELSKSFQAIPVSESLTPKVFSNPNDYLGEKHDPIIFDPLAMSDFISYSTNGKAYTGFVYDVGLPGIKALIDVNTETEKISAVRWVNNDGSMEFNSKETYLLLGTKTFSDTFTTPLSQKVLALEEGRDYGDLTKEKFLQSFNYSKTFSIKKGNAERKLIVMTDPDCPYCMQLEQELESLDNVEIIYLYYPIDSLHPEAPAKVQRLWAVAPEKRGEVWQEYVKYKRLPSSDVATKENYDFDYMRKAEYALNASATPTIINPKTGKVLSGVQNVQALDEFLNDTEKNNEKDIRQHIKLLWKHPNLGKQGKTILQQYAK